MSQNLFSRVIETKLVSWRDLQFIQHESLKDISEESKSKLRQSIVENKFAQPFYVWQDASGAIWCLDGKHRIDALHELVESGFVIPDQLPATFMRCESKQEASKLVLIYSSIYAKITQQGLFDFITEHDLNFADLTETIVLPDFSNERFEQKFDLPGINTVDEEAVVQPVERSIVSPGDMFEINGHRILCRGFNEEGALDQLIGDVKARIVFTDPPYNLPTNFFSNIKDHADFAEGHGEMTDAEFASFLKSIMQAAVGVTVPGAIHYIFMDWRHVWHMAEAARQVYGSPVPKQVCVWVKDIMANGSFYRSQQELCFTFSDGSAVPLWNKDLFDEGCEYKTDSQPVFVFKNGDAAKHLSHLDLKDRIRTNVWKYPSAVSTANPDKNEITHHPTPKPVAMVADAILDTTNPGDIVVDFFHGSGTCMMAAEKTGRFCFATEIEPKYVEHQIKRYFAYCKKKNKPVEFYHLNGPLTPQSFETSGHQSEDSELPEQPASAEERTS